MDPDIRNGCIATVLVIWCIIGPIIGCVEYRNYRTADLQYKMVERVCQTIEKVFAK